MSFIPIGDINFSIMRKTKLFSSVQTILFLSRYIAKLLFHQHIETNMKSFILSLLVWFLTKLFYLHYAYFMKFL